MRALFSIYSEDRELETVEFIRTIQVQTDWSVKQIEAHIALYEGFHSETIIGDNLSFFDYFCFYADHEDLVKRIETIPTNSHVEERRVTPCVLRAKEFDPGRVDEPLYPESEDYYLYDLSRYECGACSYEAFVYWAAAHPFAMIFVAGVVYDFFKWFILRSLKYLKIIRYDRSVRPMVLNTKKLYQNFSKAVNVKVKDCQIVKINRVKVGSFHVKMRTSTERRFKLRCTSSGAIETLEEITDIRDELYS